MTAARPVCTAVTPFFGALFGAWSPPLIYNPAVLRIGIDATPLLRTRTGVAVCTGALLDAARDLGHEVIGLVSGWRTLRDGRPDLSVPVARNWFPRCLERFALNWPTVETMVGEVDVFVWTNLCTTRARGAVNVVFVHDIGRMTHPHLYGRRQVARFSRLARRISRFTDICVVPTRAVADEIAAVGMVDRSRIEVVPLGAEPLPNGNGNGAVRGVPDGPPIVLCVARLERRKNIPGLVRAFGRAAGELPHHLVVAGGHGPAEEEARSMVRTAGLGDRVHFIGHAAPGQIGALYRRADLTICPSLYEGFGLPLLEAMAHGCPVLASDIPPHREVGGEAVRLAPAGDENRFAQTLVELGTDAAARASLKEKGLRRSRDFTWERTRRRFRDLLSSRCAP